MGSSPVHPTNFILTTKQLKQLANDNIHSALFYHWIRVLATAKDYKESGLKTWKKHFHESKKWKLLYKQSLQKGP